MSIKQASNADLLTVIEDGFKSAEEAECEGFSYTVGKVRGGTIKVSFEPDLIDDDCIDIVQIDGVDGMGYCLVFEE